MRLKKFLIQTLITISIIYFFFGLFLFFSQKSMLYYPDNQDFEECSGFRDFQKITNNGTRFYLKENSDKILVFYHGNAGSACDRSYYTRELFEQTDYSLLYVEYKGYSNDNTKPSKELMLEDVKNVDNYLESKNYSEILVYGESIGSGPASYHTSLGNVDGLILVTPFSRLVDVVQSKYILYPASIILTEKFNNIKYLENYNGKIIIIHGDSDIVIPNIFSEKLFSTLKSENKKYILIEGKGHNDIWNSNNLQKEILEFMNSSE